MAVQDGKQRRKQRFAKEKNAIFEENVILLAIKMRRGIKTVIDKIANENVEPDDQSQDNNRLRNDRVRLMTLSKKKWLWWRKQYFFWVVRGDNAHSVAIKHQYILILHNLF